MSGHKPGGWVAVAPSVEVQATAGLVQGLRETCHDMRQPIASMFALAAAALAEPGLPQAARARLELIVEQAEWLADLIRHSLHTAAPGAQAVCQTDLLLVAREAVAAECLTWTGQMRIVSLAEAVFTPVHPVVLRCMVANLLNNLAAVSRNAVSYGGRLEHGNGASGGARVSLCLPPALGQTGAGGADSKFRGMLSTA